MVVKGRHPNELPLLCWINTVLSNLKTSFSGTFDGLKFDKYTDRYLGAFNYRFSRRFNRRFNLATMTKRVVHAICSCDARPERILRSAELAT